MTPKAFGRVTAVQKLGSLLDSQKSARVRGEYAQTDVEDIMVEKYIPGVALNYHLAYIQYSSQTYLFQ